MSEAVFMPLFKLFYGSSVLNSALALPVSVGAWKWLYIMAALDLPMRSSNAESSASAMRFTLLNSFSKAAFVLGPIPFMVSNSLAIWCLLLFSRWKVMA